MTDGVFSGKKNKNGNLIIDLTMEDKSVTVPKAGRVDEAVLLAHDGRHVTVELGENGVVVFIRCGEVTLFDISTDKHSAAATSITPPTQAGQATSGARQNPTAGNVQADTHAEYDDLRLLSQRRAGHALGKVQGWEKEESSDQKALKSYASSFPAMILMSGFGQTCAFHISKGGNHKKLYDALADWLDQSAMFDSSNLMREITQSSAQKYQLAQAESLAYLNWLKKFTKAYLESEDEGDENHGTTTA